MAQRLEYDAFIAYADVDAVYARIGGTIAPPVL
jgi:hypothetical protein